MSPRESADRAPLEIHPGPRGDIAVQSWVLVPIIFKLEQ
jgi:hypothetical protein